MKLKFLLILLLIPELAFSYYVYHPCCYGNKLPKWWASFDYMWIYRKKRFYPPLATTASTGIPDLSNPTTEILFGDKNVGGKGKSGGRCDIGFWMNRCWGIGGSFFGVPQEKVKFEIEGSNAGTPTLGLPFFDVSSQANSAFFISIPNQAVDGRIAIDTTNYVWGADGYFRYRWLCRKGFSSDFLAGFLFTRVQDNLKIESSTRTLLRATSVDKTLTDRFNCRNDFYSGLLGLLVEYRRRRLIFSVAGKVGLGKMRETINLSGSTVTVNLTNQAVTFINNGLLTQPTNIGSHGKRLFEAVPQVDALLRVRLRGCIWGSVGYTWIYWPKVALSGNQVNLNIDPAPPFHAKETNFWMQGVTAGLYFGF